MRLDEMQCDVPSGSKPLLFKFFFGLLEGNGATTVNPSHSLLPIQTHACALDRSDSLKVFVPQELEHQAMVPPGLEPGTLRLLAVRSNQLSYETAGIYHFCYPLTSLIFSLRSHGAVG